MQYYVVDTTIQPKDVILFNDYSSVVRYLEQMSQRAYGQSRQQRMLLMEEMGHGTDDGQGVAFVRMMSEQFNVGIVRDRQLMRCDITSIALYQNREGYGD